MDVERYLLSRGLMKTVPYWRFFSLLFFSRLEEINGKERCSELAGKQRSALCVYKNRSENMSETELAKRVYCWIGWEETRVELSAGGRKWEREA